MSDAPFSSTPQLARVLGLVRSLIDAGRRLADKLRQGADPAELRHRARLFGTSDLAHMLARIARGLRRAAALETYLLTRAQRGSDLKIAPRRIYVPRPPSIATQPRTERPTLPLVPSDEEIAADTRRRSVGAVIVDICHDLGVQPGELAHDMHRALLDAVMYYGGNAIRLLRIDESLRRAKQYLAIQRSGAPLPPELQPIPWSHPALRAGATGPP
jgi:hypothetical protein